MFNKNIKSIAVKNYYTNPVGEPRFDNPYLLMSQNQVLNQLAINKHLLDKHRPQIQSSAKPVPKIQMTVEEEEDLARHVMQEVYADPKDRRDIQGYRLSIGLSSDEHAVYVGKNNILFGLRGSSVPKDFVADAEIGLKNVMGYPDALSQTLNNRYARDEAMYNKIRTEYPNKHIIMAGHSLGNTLGMNILKNHRDDQNLKFFGYNGWIHPDYNKDRRAYHTRQEGDLVSTFTPTDSTMLQDPSTRIGVAGVGVVGGLGYLGQQRARDNLASITREVNRLQDRANLGSTGRQVTREEIETQFPEYTNVRTVLENSDVADFDELLNTSGFDNGLYIKTSDAQALDDFLFRYSLEDGVNIENIDWTDFHDAIRRFNSGMDLAAHPELTDATDYADATDMIDPFYYPHNVYVTDGDDGLHELNVLSDTNDIEGVLNPINHSGIMDQSRITSSEILDTPGAIPIHTGTEVLETAADEDLFWMITAGEAALNTAGMVAAGATGAAALAAAAYWLWSHSAKRFKLKNNRFRNKSN